MNKLYFLPMLAAVLYSCQNTSTNNKEQEKKLFNQVMDIHNEVMNYETMIMENKTKLDSFARVSNTALKDSAMQLSKNLAIADEAMSDWMHQFEPDYSGKSHEEAMKYLNEQKLKIAAVDSVTKTAIKASWKYLSSHK